MKCPSAQRTRKLYYGFCAVIMVLFVIGVCVWKDAYYMYLDIGADTYSSYWPYYAWFSEMVRSGRFSMWSFELGFGESVMSFSSLLIDPFNLVLFLFPAQYMPDGLLLVTVLKYVALAFLARKFLSYHGLDGWALNVAGWCYTFSGFFVGWGQHYHFASMFVLFTLVLTAFERYLRTGRRLLLTLSVAMLAAHSLYFTYMALLFLAVYALVVYFARRAPYSLAGFAAYAGKLLGMIVLGLMISAVSFLPQAVALLNSPRVSGKVMPSLKPASFAQYAEIAGRFLSDSIFGINENYGVHNFYEAPFLYVGILMLFCVAALLYRTRSRTVRVCAGLAAASLVFCNAFNPVLNAFSQNGMRWTFVLVPVLCLGVGKGWNALTDPPRALPAGAAALVGAVFWALAFFSQTGIWEEPTALNLVNRISLIASAVFLVGYLLWILFARGRGRRTLTAGLAVLLCAELALNFGQDVLSRSLLPRDEAWFEVPYLDETSALVDAQRQEDPEFFRVAKDYGENDLTDPLIQGYYGEKAYSSVLPQSVWDLQETMNLRGGNSNYLYGFGQNEILRGLFAGKYFLSEQETARWGYELVRQGETADMWQNSFYVPLGYAQNGVIDRDTFETWNLAEKTAAMALGCVVDDDAPEYERVERADVKPFVQLEPLRTIVQSFDELDETDGDYRDARMFEPLYTGLEPETVVDLPEPSSGLLLLTFETDNEVERQTVGRIYYRTAKQSYSLEQGEYFSLKPEQTHYEILLSVQDLTQLRIDLPEGLEMNLLDVEVRAWDTEALMPLIQTLREGASGLRQTSGNTLEGDVRVTEDSIVVAAVPCAAGWRITVDSQPVEPIEVNYAMTGIPVTAGEHRIEMHYVQPGMESGAVISLFGAALTLVFWKLDQRRKYAEK